MNGITEVIAVAYHSIRVSHLALASKVTLAANKNQRYVWSGVLSNLLKPRVQVLKGAGGCHVKTQQNTICAAIKAVGDAPETLLPGSIPRPKQEHRSRTCRIIQKDPPLSLSRHTHLNLECGLIGLQVG